MMRAICLCVLMLVTAITPALPAEASNYQLHQVIEPIVCTNTAVHTGTIVTVSSSCSESYLPMITEVIVTDTKLILRGKYDSLHSRSLRIQVFGVWYTLGESPNFTSSGDIWQLDLSTVRPVITPGQYDVRIAFTTSSSLYYGTTIVDRLVIPPLTTDTPPETDVPSATAGQGSSLADTGQSMRQVLWIAVGLVLAGGGTGMFLLSRRRKRN